MLAIALQEHLVQQRKHFNNRIIIIKCADPEGGGGSGSVLPEKSQKNIGFLSNACPDPMKNHKAAKPAFSVGPLSAHQ